MEGEAEARHPSSFADLVKEESGYVRELSRADCDNVPDDGEEAQQLFEASAYQHHYSRLFQQENHINYVTTPQPEGELGPMAISIQRMPHDGDRNELQVLIHSKEGWEFEKLSAESVEEWGGHMQALKRVRPVLDSITVAPRADDGLKERLAKYEQRMISLCHKFGILYCKAGQTEELEIYNNEEGSTEFENFLAFLGNKVDLQGFDSYNGGLDTKSNTTGTHSIYTRFGEKGDECEIMFHPLTYLPYSAADPQQIERKRHIGNDVVVVVFREDDDTPFSSSSIQSQFNHVFVVTTPVKKGDETFYRVAISRKAGIPSFGPPLPDSCIIKSDDEGRRWFLRKLINAERAAFKSPTFQKKFVNVRKFQLQYILQDAKLEDETEHVLLLLSQTTNFSRPQLEVFHKQVQTALNLKTKAKKSRNQMTAEEFQQIFAHICPSWKGQENERAVKRLYSVAKLNGDKDTGLTFIDFVHLIDGLAHGGPGLRLGMLRQVLPECASSDCSESKEGSASSALQQANLLSEAYTKLSFSEFKKRVMADHPALLDLFRISLPEKEQGGPSSTISLVPSDFVASQPEWWKQEDPACAASSSSSSSSSESPFWQSLYSLMNTAQYYSWRLG